MTLDGTLAEFGVYKGTSLTQIAKFFPDRTVHGFDSFVGLPDAWGGTSKGAGAFDIGAKPPELSVSNVKFHVGWFDETVPAFAQKYSGPFAFAHLDADLYSSTKTVFDKLSDWFVPGTIVVFDEYFGYHGWQLHEHKAFQDSSRAPGSPSRRSAWSHEPRGASHQRLRRLDVARATGDSRQALSSSALSESRSPEPEMVNGSSPEVDQVADRLCGSALLHATGA